MLLAEDQVQSRVSFVVSNMKYSISLFSNEFYKNLNFVLILNLKKNSSFIITRGRENYVKI